jgi:hypothetical protein
MHAPSLPNHELSDDAAAQITLMAALLPDLALRQDEASALLALHRLRFPLGDVARLGPAAIARAASERRLAYVALPVGIAATPAAAHNASLAVAIIQPDYDVVWITVAAVLVAAGVGLFGVFIVRAFAVGADILRQKSQWDFDDAEYVRAVNRRCVRRARDAHAARGDGKDAA